VARSLVLSGRPLFGRRRAALGFVAHPGRRFFPGVVLRVERFVALPQRQGEVQELPHGVPDGDGLVVGVLGDHATVEGAHGRVKAHGRQGGHPQVAAHQVVAAPAHDVAARPARLAVAIDAAAHLDGERAEVGDELAGGVEAVDVEDEGGEDGGGDGADARDGVEVIGLRQAAIGPNQQVFQAFLPGVAIAELSDLIAQQFLGGRPGQRGDRGACVSEQRGDVLVGEVGDGGEIVFGRGGEELGGGVAMDEFEDPALRDVFDEEGEFGEGEGQEVVELVDEAGALPDGGLESGGNLA